MAQRLMGRTEDCLSQRLFASDRFYRSSRVPRCTATLSVLPFLFFTYCPTRSNPPNLELFDPLVFSAVSDPQFRGCCSDVGGIPSRFDVSTSGHLNTVPEGKWHLGRIHRGCRLNHIVLSKKPHIGAGISSAVSLA